MAIKMRNLMKMVVQGQNGHSIYFGYKAFTTTAATTTIDIPMKVIKSIAFGIAGAPAADEVLSLTATVNADGEIRRSTLAALTVTRTGASKTSGLGFWYIAIGEA